MVSARGPPIGRTTDQGGREGFPDYITWPLLALTNSERSLYYFPMPNTTQTAPKMSCPTCNAGCQRFGTHRNGLRRFRCPVCKKTFTEAHERTLGTMYVTQDRAVLALRLLLEGNSIRSTERITGLDRNTIMRLLILAGERCQSLMDAKMWNLSSRYLQVDEIWTYVGKKRRNVRDGDSPELGDQWVYVAIDEQTKLIPAFRVGKRVRPETWAFLWDLHKRLANRVQLTTDGLNHYTVTVPECFGTDVDFAQLVKLFESSGNGPEARYSPPRITEVISKVRIGDPDPDHISTSFVERQNLTMRMQMRRFTRLTNGFSKKLANLKAAVALHFAYYNFCRVHSSLRVTPAMEAGLTDHVWTINELLA
jgi:transposase-like protein/IS1 family transposase